MINGEKKWGNPIFNFMVWDSKDKVKYRIYSTYCPIISWDIALWSISDKASDEIDFSGNVAQRTEIVPKPKSKSYVAARTTVTVHINSQMLIDLWNQNAGCQLEWRHAVHAEWLILRSVFACQLKDLYTIIIDNQVRIEISWWKVVLLTNCAPFPDFWAEYQ